MGASVLPATILALIKGNNKNITKARTLLQIKKGKE